MQITLAAPDATELSATLSEADPMYNQGLSVQSAGLTTATNGGNITLVADSIGIANTIVKPILTLLTLPLVIVTLGLFYFVINVLMLALAEWIAPDFSIDGFWTYVGATIVVWLVNWIVWTLVDSLADEQR